MVAFLATAAGESISVDGNEIVEARWFTRAELREYEQAQGQLGRVDSIDRVLVGAWLAGGDQGPHSRG
jgi:NAD+ diphosphatase